MKWWQWIFIIGCILYIQSQKDDTIAAIYTFGIFAWIGYLKISARLDQIDSLIKHGPIPKLSPEDK